MDEEFKTQLSVILGPDTPLTKTFWASAERTRRNSKKLHQKIDSRISPVLVRTPFGYQHPVYLDRVPIEMVISKTVRGLYWLETNQIIPAQIQPKIHLLNSFESPPAQIISLLNEFGKSVQKCGNQFEAVFAITEKPSLSSIWLLRFHDRDCFWVAVSPHFHD